MPKNPDPHAEAHEQQGRDADARRLVDDVPPLPRDPPRPARGVGVRPDRASGSSRRSATPTAAPRSSSPATSTCARGVLGEAETRYMTFCDPDKEFVTSLGLSACPPSSTSARTRPSSPPPEGWDPHSGSGWREGDRQGLKWSHPEVSGPGDPATTPGWPGLTWANANPRREMHKCTSSHLGGRDLVG